MTTAGPVSPADSTGRPVFWGVIATGSIAARVTADLALLDDAVLQAVSSRSAQSATAFAERFGFATSYSNDDGGATGYAQLLADPRVEVVYIATPHTQHYAVALAALEAGKSVLCEKPLTMNAREAHHLVECARSKGLFLMEAVWTRFLPSFRRALEVVESGEIGTVRWIQADLGFPAPYDPASRLWDPAAGGGALLDLAVYPLTWALAALGESHALSARGSLNSDGVDLQNALTLTFDGGAHAQLTTSIAADCPSVVTITGTDGWLRTSAPLFNPGELVIQPRQGTLRTEQFGVFGNGFSYELREVMRCLQAGFTESAVMPHGDSVRVMGLLDDARRQMGLRYASDIG
ncbi:Gfo/Idh/MocA family protein [Arthrobacter sp. H41]|uniref:Gfo/Idh/MocA family protein n=1 Tax=Arthrobacter sp. H41 TaxID=1312978 RepID=UPI00047B9ADC|nr:Gfo/Idh/MocA family oxidoreductase [Arthrobacter sp. H41]